MGERLILVVDDDPAFRQLMRDFLSEEGFVVALAATAEEARAMAVERRPDAVLLDLGPEGEDADELFLRHRTSGEPVPVIVVSAWRDGASRAARYGAAGFLAKPLDLLELLALIEDVIAAAAVERRPEPAA